MTVYSRNNKYLNKNSKELVSDSAFSKICNNTNLIDNLINSGVINNLDTNPEKDIPFNYCPECNILMDMDDSSEYKCNNCGIMKRIVGGLSGCNSTSSSTIAVSGKNRRVTYYCGNVDYSKTQKKATLSLLLQNNSMYNGPSIPRNILNKTAEDFSEIQKLVVEDIDYTGCVISKKKFVLRGNNREQTIGDLLYFNCIDAGLARKKSDIAKFMRLNSNGLCRGEERLLDLQAEGKITICSNKEIYVGFVERYFEALNLDKHPRADAYKNFIIDIIKRTIDKYVCFNSMPSSKASGAIWLLVKKEYLEISPELIFKKCDETRRSTFERFVNEVDKNILHFIDIFEKYSINTNIYDKIRKVSK